MRGTRGTGTAIGLLVAAITAGGAAPAGAADRAFAPVDRPGPALSVPAERLRASLACTDDVASGRTPVLLLPATTVDSRENYGWNWIPALRARGFPVCTSDQPHDPHNMGDMQIRGEYVTYAIRRVHELAGRRISIVGHSQGGQIMRWSLRFWPDTRAMVDDVVALAATNHGSALVPALCVPDCAASLWQQTEGSAYMRALNSGQETFAGVSYTNVYSRTDEFVQPNLDDGGTTSLRTGDGRITNVALQEVCPADLNEHLLIGTTDATAWALGLDALTHDGPADESRIDPAVCRQDAMPGVDRPNGLFPLGDAFGRVGRELLLAPHVPREPELRCHVFADCPQPAPVAGARTAAPAVCRGERVRSVRVDRLGLRAIRVTVAGRRAVVRRGRVRVDLRGRRGVVTVRITGRRKADGRRVTVVRRLRACTRSTAG